jgi:hypothetical protein
MLRVCEVPVSILSAKYSYTEVFPCLRQSLVKMLVQ